MNELSDGLARFAVLAIAAAVVTSIYCGPGAIIAVVIALIFLVQFFGRLNP
jgi:hypothetical protein